MRRSSIALLALAALALPGGALAAPPPVSSVSQYVESIPTSSGSIAAGPQGDGQQPAQPVPLSREARSELAERGGADARALEDLATRPEYGASPVRNREGRRVTLDFTPVSAAFAATGSGAATSLLPLFVGMALIALATVLTAGRARD